MKIIFICTGNANRSPLAEYILKDKLQTANIAGVEVTSAGTLDWGAHPRDEKMVQISAEKGITICGQTTPVTLEMLHDADYMVAMVAKHQHKVQAYWNESTGIR